MTKLSIIVPVYNVEQYLRKCVDSLLAQDISDYEIILVDDGSTDGSGAICDEYELKAKSQELRVKSASVRVIHRKNGGLSAARNSGLEVARGEYVMFVDSDDYLQMNVLGTLIDQMEDKRLDVLRYNYKNVRLAKSEELRGKSEYEVFEPFKTGKPYFDYSSEVVDGETFLNERLGYACYAVMFMIRRDLIFNPLNSSSENTLFTPGIYFEDTDWTPRMLMRAKRAASTEMIVYNYLWREGSITLPDNPQKKKKVLEDKMRQIVGFQEQKKLVKDQRWFAWKTTGAAIGILNSVCAYKASDRDYYIKQLELMNIFPLSMYRADRNSRIKIIIANISPTLYCKLIKLIHR